MAIVEFFTEDRPQCKTGDVVKAGSKYIYVRERNAGPRPVIKIGIKKNGVTWLLGDKNPYDRAKGVPRT